MGKQFDKITESQVEFIQKQKVFFVGTAAESGSVNVSPKGMDSLRIIDENKVAWLNLTGSGNETSAHVQVNPRMTLMFCAFEGPPLILRLYGTAQVLHQADEAWETYLPLFPVLPGSRQIFLLDVEKTQSSCGMAVPFFDFKEERVALVEHATRQGKEGLESYWKKKNQLSIDGLSTHILERSGLDDQ